MSRKRERHPVTWLEVAVRNAGIRFGVRGLTYAVQWALARELLGREPTVAEVGEVVGDSRPTAYREWGLFRRAFPELRSPGELIDSVPDLRPKIANLARALRDLDEDEVDREVDAWAARYGVQPGWA